MAKTQRETEEKLLSKLNKMWDEYSAERQQYEQKWYLYCLWVRGFQYARYDKNTKRVVSKPVKDGRPQITINKIYPTLRNVRNYVLRNQPKAQVTPEGMKDGALKQSMKANKFLESIHETEKLRPKLKNTVFQALENAVGWWQVLWNGEKIEVNEIDVFDYYPDPKAFKDPTKGNGGIIAVSRRISDLLEDPKYIKEEVEKLKADNKQSASTYKEMLLSFEKSGQTSSDDKKSGTVIVKEFWYKEDSKFYVCAKANERIIRKPEEVDTTIIPVFRLQSDVMPFSMYGEGWVKNMIDPQKMLNSSASSVAEYNLIMNKVKVVMDKGAGVRTWNNETGQFIEKKKGYDVKTQTPAPMNNAIFEQISLSERWIEDIGGMHDAMSGRVPTGAKSGRAIEALQVGDSNNMSEVVENIEDFLEDVYEYILWIASKKYQDLKQISVTDYTGQREFLQVIGADSPVAQKMMESDSIPENTLIISDKNLVDVKISSYLSYTPESKRESVKELVGILPDLPEDVILDAFGVGNIADVIAKIKQKRAEQVEQEAQAQKQQAQVQQDVQSPEASGQEALAAIRTMIEGGSPQVPARAGQQYIGALDQFLQREQELQELDPEILQTIQTFRDQVVQGVGRL